MARTAPPKRRPRPRKPAAKRRGPATPPPKGGFPVWPVVIGLVVALGVAVVVFVALSGDDVDTAGGGGTPVEESAGPVEVTGEALPQFESTEDDAALGLAFPTLTGTGLDGEPLTIARGEQPTLVLFVAHWCSHCQREVPVVQEWVDAGNLPDDVELVTVSTSIDPSRPNHPSSAWLAANGWTAPTLVDPDNSAATAAGLSAYPFFVALDANGRVVARTSGELTTDQLDGLVELAQG
ncbi:MAG: TlpA family protein disulfide reductase [Acidimicrobiales bacterium]